MYIVPLLSNAVVYPFFELMGNILIVCVLQFICIYITFGFPAHGICVSVVFCCKLFLGKSANCFSFKSRTCNPQIVQDQRKSSAMRRRLSLVTLPTDLQLKYIRIFIRCECVSAGRYCEITMHSFVLKVFFLNRLVLENLPLLC